MMTMRDEPVQLSDEEEGAIASVVKAHGPDSLREILSAVHWALYADPAASYRAVANADPTRRALDVALVLLRPENHRKRVLLVEEL
jgi:hypothetical protein